jgi:hypothetical protein
MNNPLKTHQLCQLVPNSQPDSNSKQVSSDYWGSNLINETTDVKLNPSSE